MWHALPFSKYGSERIFHQANRSPLFGTIEYRMDAHALLGRTQNTIGTAVQCTKMANMIRDACIVYAQLIQSPHFVCLNKCS